MEVGISFGEWLHNQRRNQDLTRQAFADQVGCAEITLRRIEKGSLRPSRALGLILLQKIGVPADELEAWVQFARGLSGLPDKRSQPFSSPKPKTNLTIQLTSFIGREKELAEVIRLITRHRLVTLVGSGGVGKTRLALKVGDQLLENYVDGIWLVELAPLNSSDLIPQAIAALFGLTLPPNTNLTEILTRFLSAKRMLLILDNCEHVLDGCARQVDFLLKNCPDLKILATSREAFGILGEASYRVPSLGLPDLQFLVDKFRDFESVRLFEERAQLVQSNFVLTVENASAIAKICNRLDGIPLALELASVKVNLFSPAEIAVQLDQCFQLLTGGSRTALPRQQTIRASIDWSWNLLADQEKILLRRLSVFSGGWMVESAGAVCQGDGIDRAQVADLLAQLAQKSLVAAGPVAGGTMRYHLLETIRQYANEKLSQAGEEPRIRRQHVQYFLELSQKMEPALHGPQQLEWRTLLDQESDNVHNALEWAAVENVEAGLHLSIKLYGWYTYQDCMRWQKLFIQNPQAQDYPGPLAKTLLAYGYSLWYLQQFDEARAVDERALALFRACGDQQGEFDCLLELGAVLQYLENIDSKIELQVQALQLARSIEDVWRQARALGALAWGQPDFQLSRAYREEAIVLFRQVGDWRNLALNLSILGSQVLQNGEIEIAQKYIAESSVLMNRLKIKKDLEFVLITQSQMALMRGDYDQAQTIQQECVDLMEEAGNRMGYLWARARLGNILLCRGEVSAARQMFVDAGLNFQKDHNITGLAYILEKMASLYVAIDKPERGACLLGRAEAARAEIGASRLHLEQSEVDRNTAACLEKLGRLDFDEAQNKGRAMILDEAVAYAFEEE